MEPLVYWYEEEEVLDVEPGWELSNNGAVLADVLGEDGPTGSRVRADTSQSAADSVSVMPSWVEFAHLAIDLGQFTAEELVAFAVEEGVKYKPSRLRTCMREWEQYGWLCYTGGFVRTESGRRARIAELTPVGWRKAEELTGRTVDEWGNPAPRDIHPQLRKA